MHPGVHHCSSSWFDQPKIGPVGLDGHAAYFGFMLVLHLVDTVGYAGTSTPSAMADLLFPGAVKRCPRHEDGHCRVFCEGDTARFTGKVSLSARRYVPILAGLALHLVNDWI